MFYKFKCKRFLAFVKDKKEAIARFVVGMAKHPFVWMRNLITLFHFLRLVKPSLVHLRAFFGWLNRILF